MSNRTITIVFTIAVLAIVAIALALATNARAEVAPAFRSNYGWYWGSTPCEECRRIREIQRRRAAREWRRKQAYRERERYERHEHRHTRKVWRDDREYVIERDDRHERHERSSCKHEIAVVGDQYVSEEGAKSEADKQLAQTSRYMFGERFMAKDHAKHVRYECGRSSVGSVVGQIFYRCRVFATPCSPAIQRAN